MGLKLNINKSKQMTIGRTTSLVWAMKISKWRIACAV